MAKNRYGRDYRLVETFDEKGRVKTTTEYIGAAYRFAGEPGIVRACIRHMLFSCAAGWGLYIAAMVLPSTAMRRLYCALPMLFTAVPLFLTTDYALTLRGLDPTKELEHRHADLMSNRYPPAALFAAAFPAFALAGELVSLVTGASMLTGDVLFVICCAGLVVTGRYLFARRNVPELKIHAVKEEEKKPGNEA